MKVKLYVCKHEEVEVEIDDKFRKLAVDKPWLDSTITNEDYEECAAAVEAASGLPFGEKFTDEKGYIDYHQNYVEVAWSAENGETMLED